MHNLLFLCALGLSFFFHQEVVFADTYFCTHPELCRLGTMVAPEIKFDNIIILSGDPHEFEPSIADIKKLIVAQNLIVGPHELNPWMKKISILRNKEKNLKTLNINLPNFSLTEYPTNDSEALGHFWLYPKIYCELKKQLAKTFNHNIKCDPNTIEEQLKLTLHSLKTPIILTHDALLPLLKKLSINQNQITAIKGSGHHEETSAAAVKNVYSALKSPRVIWIFEDNINVSENIKNKIRKNDLIINIETAKSMSNEDDFSILQNLNKKLQDAGLK
jgi:ABC-type Zn uptake system ZnuABC Zn-binding protein ZnuA